MREAPTDIKLKRGEGVLEVSWRNETPSTYPVRQLRCECVCAGCVDERTGVRRIVAGAALAPRERDGRGSHAQK